MKSEPNTEQINNYKSTEHNSGNYCDPVCVSLCYCVMSGCIYICMFVLCVVYLSIYVYVYVCVCQVIVHEVPGQELEVEVFDKDPDQDDFLGR